MKHGLCSNFNNCNNADQRTVVSLQDGQDMICPICGGTLSPTYLPTQRPNPLPRVLAIVGAVCLTVVVARSVFLRVVGSTASRGVPPAFHINVDSSRLTTRPNPQNLNQLQPGANKPITGPGAAAPTSGKPTVPGTAGPTINPETTKPGSSTDPESQSGAEIAQSTSSGGSHPPRSGATDHSPSPARRHWNVPGE